MTRRLARAALSLLLALLCASQAYALQPIKDATFAQDNAPNVVLPAFSPDPATGDLVVVTVVSYILGGHGVTDSASHTYTQIGATTVDPNGDRFVSMWYVENISAVSNLIVTGHCTGGTQCGVTAWLIQGAKTSGAYNSDSTTANGTTTNPSGAASSPAPSVQSFFLAVMGYANFTATSGTGWNTVGVYGFTSGMDFLVTDKTAYAGNTVKTSVEYKVGSTAQTPSWGTSGSTLYAIRVASFAGTGVWSASAAPPFPPLFIAIP